MNSSVSAEPFLSTSIEIFPVTMPSQILAQARPVALVSVAATVADRHYLLAQGAVVESLDNAEFKTRQSELLEHLGM